MARRKMDFSRALKELKAGNRLSRAGWNGKGMCVYLVGPERREAVLDIDQWIAEAQPDKRVPCRAYLVMKTVDGDIVPWVASQSDILANDWDLFFRLD